ncbi:DUF3135 domain-containing protein [Candidatus Kaiserbacteria bacterium]|nr:DUF3135 domain-containing protein [Candidatus Kaiserbacteria bacterium]
MREVSIQAVLAKAPPEFSERLKLLQSQVDVLKLRYSSDPKFCAQMLQYEMSASLSKLGEKLLELRSALREAGFKT